MKKLFLAVAGVAGAAAIGLLVGCGGCDFATECAARAGVSEASVNPGGNNRLMCGDQATVSSTFSGPNLVETKGVVWLSATLSCYCLIEDGVTKNCTSKPR